MRFFWSRRHSDNSFNDPLLAEEDGSAETYRQPGELDDLFARFGRSLLNASPKDISRLKAAVENDNAEEISEIVGNPSASSNPTKNETKFVNVDMSQESLFKMAVEDYKTEWVEFFLRKITDQSIRFDVAAAMMKENFRNLWLDYRILMENVMRNDVLGWDICTIEVPLETFTNECNMGSRVGTCNTISEWIEASREGIGHEHWRSLNPKGVDKVLKKTRGRKENAIVKIFCIENACQVGLDGIVRFLLMHKAPSFLFKTPLLEWVIAFKWERVWKVLAIKRLAWFLLFFVGFHIFAFVVSDETLTFVPYKVAAALVVYSLTTSILLPILTIRRQCFQLKRSFLDGRKMFPSNPFQGIRKYFGARPNQIDLLLSGLMVVIFVTIYETGGYDKYKVTGAERVFFSALAIEVLLIWAKAFYLTQAFTKSGVFAVMIGRVLQETASYFLILLGIIISFGFAMRIAFVKGKDNGDHYGYPAMPSTNESWPGKARWDRIDDVVYGIEVENEVQTYYNTFGSLLISILTMAYALVGLFDPEALSDCAALPGLMMALFVTYLVLQTIVMFNVLVASMGDAFDGVKAAEEELFLMTRANFIDQLESSLSNKDIQQIRSRIGKYLYVLIQENEKLEETAPLWKGRLPTIKEDVTKIVRGSQNQSNQNMNDLFKTLREDIKNDMKSLKEEILTLKQRIGDRESNP